MGESQFLIQINTCHAASFACASLLYFFIKYNRIAGKLSLGQWEGFYSVQIRDQLALFGTKEDEHALHFPNIKTFVTLVVQEYLFLTLSSACIMCEMGGPSVKHLLGGQCRANIYSICMF